MFNSQGRICRWGEPGIFPITGFHIPLSGSKAAIPIGEAYFPS